MEPSRQQAVRSDQNGWGATLRRALRSTHIINREQGLDDYKGQECLITVSKSPSTPALLGCLFSHSVCAL